MSEDQAMPKEVIVPKVHITPKNYYESGFTIVTGFFQTIIWLIVIIPSTWGIRQLFDFTLFEASLICIGFWIVIGASNIRDELRKGLKFIRQAIEDSDWYEDEDEDEDEDDLESAFDEYLQELIHKRKRTEAVRLYRNIMKCNIAEAQNYIKSIEN